MSDMSIESVDLDFNTWSQFQLPIKEETMNFSQVIFSSSNHKHKYMRGLTLNRNTSDTCEKTQNIYRNQIRPCGKIGAEISFDISWGKDDGPEISVSASGSASDDNGNTVEVTVEVSEDGSGNASVSVQHEEN